MAQGGGGVQGAGRGNAQGGGEEKSRAGGGGNAHRGGEEAGGAASKGTYSIDPGGASGEHRGAPWALNTLHQRQETG